MNYITILGFIWSFKIEIDTSIFQAAEAIGLPLNKFLYALDCHLIVLAELFKDFHVKMIILTLIPGAFISFYHFLFDALHVKIG